MRILLPLLTFTLLFFGKVNAQTTILDTRKGLSNNTILDIIQDPSGLTWVGTGSGLNTYDGYNFKEVPAFKGMTINCLVYDSLRECIWVGARQGMFTIVPKTGEVVDFTAKCKLKNVEVILFHEEKIYFGFSNGLILQMDQQLNPKIFFDGRKYHKKFYLCRHVITVGWDNYLYLTFTGMDSLITIDLDPNRKKTTTLTQHGLIWNMFSFDSLLFLNKQDQGGFIWNERSKTYIHCQALTDLNKSYPQPDIVYYKNNKLYVGYRGARSFFMIDLLKPEQPAILMPDKEQIIRGKLITCMLEDKHGVKWLGTATGLIKIVTESKLNCENFLDKRATPINIRQIAAQNDSTLFINTYDGVYVLNRHNNTVNPIYTGAEKGVSLRTIFPQTRYLYIGTESLDLPLSRLDLKASRNSLNTPTSIMPDGPLKEVGAIYSFLKDETGLFWLATHWGLMSYDPNKNILKRYKEGRFSTGKKKLNLLTKSKTTNQFWAVGKDGLYLIHTQFGITKRFTPSSALPIPPDEYTSVSEAPDGSIWIGSKKNGVVIIHPELKTISQLKENNGLSNNEVYSIVWTDSTVVWITTFNGLCRFDLKTGTFSNYFKENGIPDNEFSQASHYYSNDKKLFIGGLNGVTAFYPNTIKPLTEPFKVFFRSVLKWNSFSQSFVEVFPEGEERTIKMYPSDHLLTFELGIGDYSSSHSAVYYYRVKGLYNDWIEMKDQNILRLEGLPVGISKVEVIAFNNHGLRSSNTLTFQIQTIQVFYKTWWFYLLLLSVVSILFYIYFRWRIGEIKKKQKLRTEIASNLHDEVGSLLTSISIYADNALHHSPTLEEKNAKLEQVFSFSRDATATMSDVLWSIDARNDYAGSLTDRIREHTELLLGPLGVEIEFDFTETDQEQMLKPDVRQHIYLIFKEIINNIAKHSAATKVTIYYKQQGQAFELFVSNNLPEGFDEESVGAGQGLMNMKMRAAKIHAGLMYKHSTERFTVHLKKS